MDKHWRCIIIILTIICLLLLHMDISQLNHGGFLQTSVITPYYQVLQQKPPINITRCKNLQNLRNVILVVNYNTPHYASIPILKRYYSTLFADIVFCGENEHPEVIKIDERKGYLGYTCLATVIHLRPGR